MQNEEELNIIELLDKFDEIASKGWVESRRSHNTGIGKTFEDLLEKDEDNLADPDYKGIEVKTHRSASESYTSLFTASPTGPEKSENTRLREAYGNLDPESNLKTLHSSIFATRKTNYFNTYKFQVEVDRTEEKVFLLVFNMDYELIERRTYWTFEELNKRLERKLKLLSFVDGKNKIENGKEYFKYEKMTICKFKDFDKFLKALENGTIMLDIRIGVYASGKNKGKTHDHGTGFRIKESNLEEIYDVIAVRENEKEDN